MDTHGLRGRLEAHLATLAGRIGPRPPGSAANRQATDYLQSILTAAGLEVQVLPFSTRWWEPGFGTLGLADGSRIEVRPNPYSPPGQASGSVVRLEGRDELDRTDLDLRGRVIVLGPELGGEPVMPTAFPFFMPEEHRQLIAFIKRHEPAAVIAASDRHTSMPCFEDPDLGVPTITVAPATAARLRTGDVVQLTLGGRTRPGRGVNISGGTHGSGPRIVVSAHVDGKATTPGAFDNAAGVAVLLALAESGIEGLGPVELVFFNGEDHFDACGEQAWLAATDLSQVGLNINLDGVGVVGRDTAVAAIGCPPAVQRAVDETLLARAGWATMSPWFESDHAIFAAQAIPALAITSAGVHDLFVSVAHTAADTPDMVDVRILEAIVVGLRALLPQAVAALDVPVRL